MMRAMTDSSPIQPEVRFVTVSPEQAGQRIDNFLLRELKGVPKSMIYRIIRKGEVRVNKGRIKAVYRLKAGDSVRIPPVRVSEQDNSTPPEHLLQRLRECLLHEDKDLLVIDKPSGMAVHGGSGIRFGVIEVMRSLRPDLDFLELVHRLDRDTSGVLLLAKNRDTLLELHRQIKEHEVDKRYLALVNGPWHNDGDMTVKEALERTKRGGESMVMVSRHGKPAVTHFHPVSKYRGTTLVEAVIETGRTHQIRVHAAHIEHPVAGDDKYGDRDFNASMKKRGLGHLFLHAHSLAFIHPRSHEPMHFSSPLPQDLQAVLNNLEGGK